MRYDEPRLVWTRTSLPIIIIIMMPLAVIGRTALAQNLAVRIRPRTCFGPLFTLAGYGKHL